MRTYRSHKLVQAAPIYGADPKALSIFTATSDGLPSEEFRLPAGFFARGTPAPGDYLVRYEPDGYLSWSPKAVFEAGYALVDGEGTEASDAPNPEPQKGLDFGEALRRLKRGDRVAREGWNGKGAWLSLSGPLEGRLISSEQFWSPNNRLYADGQPLGEAKVLPCITMKTADGSILMGWLASQTDMLASDWCMVPSG